MKKHLQDRTQMAILLCAVMLLFCFGMLARYLAPVLFSDAAPEGAAFGMVLIDIADKETAESYHVENFGVYVLAVQDESPAFQAGVYSGDRLLSVKQLPVTATNEFVAMQDRFESGEKVRLDFQRAAELPSYAVTLEWNRE